MATEAAIEARKQANLRLLQRTCGDNVVGIEQTATHVVLYEYKNAWHKCNVEGSFFLVTTRAAPYYQLIILNRNSAENFIMDVTETLQAQHQEPYLIVKQDTIKGIWFHADEERVNMFTALQSTIQKLKQGHVPIASLGFDINQGSSSSIGDPQPVDPQMLATLLSPMALGAAAATTTAPPQSAVPGSSAAPPSLPAALTTPMRAGSNGSASTPSLPQTPGVALDKKSLQLALLSLIQDDRFLDLLHSQYLRVVKSRTKRGNNSG